MVFVQSKVYTKVPHKLVSIIVDKSYVSSDPTIVFREPVAGILVIDTLLTKLISLKGVFTNKVNITSQA